MQATARERGRNDEIRILRAVGEIHECADGLGVLSNRPLDGRIIRRGKNQQGRTAMSQISFAVSAPGHLDCSFPSKTLEVWSQRGANHLDGCPGAEQLAYLPLRHSASTNDDRSPPANIQEERIVSHRLGTFSAGSLAWLVGDFHLSNCVYETPDMQEYHRGRAVPGALLSEHFPCADMVAHYRFRMPDSKPLASDS